MLAHVRDLPLQDLTVDRDIHDLADLAPEHRAADRRRRRHHRQHAVAARPGERDARTDRREKERAALAGVGILDLDDRADDDARVRRELARPKSRQRIDLAERLLRAPLLRAAERTELVRGARVFAFLVGCRAIARFDRGRIAGGERGRADASSWLTS